jgi:hypothetical protein
VTASARAGNSRSSNRAAGVPFTRQGEAEARLSQLPKIRELHGGTRDVWQEVDGVDERGRFMNWRRDDGNVDEMRKAVVGQERRRGYVDCHVPSTLRDAGPADLEMNRPSASKSRQCRRFPLFLSRQDSSLERCCQLRRLSFNAPFPEIAIVTRTRCDRRSATHVGPPLTVSRGALPEQWPARVIGVPPASNDNSPAACPGLLSSEIETW